MSPVQGCAHGRPRSGNQAVKACVHCNGRGRRLPVQVFGQEELVEHILAGGEHYSHLVSIGNPRRPFQTLKPDTRIPALFRRKFQGILRLDFFDVEQKRHLAKWQFPKRIPRRSDVKRAIRFFRDTKESATGYTIHCWRGVSRSTAFALGFLYMITGSEDEAKRMLQYMRPAAGPHRRIVEWFDAELGSNLVAVNAEIRQERLEHLMHELALNEDALLEELPAAEE